MNPILKRIVGPELFSQFNRIRIVTHTSKGALLATDGEPRVFKVWWNHATVGFSDEPWDFFAGKIKANAIIDLGKMGGKYETENGGEESWPNWWFCLIGLMGFYRQDVYLDDQLVLSKPVTDPWHNTNIPQTSSIALKLAEHPGLQAPRHIRLWQLRCRLHMLN